MNPILKSILTHLLVAALGAGLVKYTVPGVGVIKCDVDPNAQTQAS